MIRSAANDTLLTYEILTDPDPLQASPLQGSASYGALTIVVSNTTSASIYCNQIQFSFIPGDLPQNLTDVTTGILVQASPADKWQIAETGTCVFTATPVGTENRLDTTGLVFQIYNLVVNKSVGTFKFDVEETSSTTNDNFSPHHAEFSLAKFPYGFFFSNFAPDKPQVQNGQPVTLTWLGADGPIYTLFYANQAVDVTETRTWTSPPLHSDTSFMLQATVNEQGETVSTRLTTTVIVADPDFVADTITVRNTASFNGSIKANSDVSIRGALDIEKDIRVKGLIDAANDVRVKGLLDVGRDATIKGKFSVENETRLRDARIDGRLDVGGRTTLAQTIISGQLQTKGAATMFGKLVQLSGAGDYVATTDGFVIGCISPQGGSQGTTVITILCGDVMMQASGGHSGSLVLYNSMMVPVPANESFAIIIDANGNNTVSLWWSPVGVGTIKKLDAPAPQGQSPRLSEEPRDNEEERK